MEYLALLGWSLLLIQTIAKRVWIKEMRLLLNELKTVLGIRGINQ